jgi:hypothetical protein
MFKTKTKLIFSLFFLVIFSLAFLPIDGEAVSPVFNNNSGDFKTFSLSKTNDPYVYEDSVSGSSGDVIYFDIYYHNNVVGTTAENTTIRIDYPCSAKSKIVPKAYISADNASTVSDTAIINVSGDEQKLDFDNIAKWYPNQTKTATNISVTQVGDCAVEVNIGSIQGCWEYQGNVIFEATLIDDDDDDDDDAEGDLSCYSSTEDSIKLEYDFENGDDVSLFRGNTRIETWTSSDGSGKITDDDDLDEDESYTYYLRNGKSSSSTRLAKVTCSTGDDDDDDDDDAEGDLSCYSSTEDSIRLEYDFENGDDVSLFRGDRRIETWTSSDRSGKITDDDLDEDESYTYYLRNGKSSSSTRLAKVTCSTGDEDDDDDEDLVVEKTVRSLSKYGFFSSYLNATPGELISYSIKISAEDADAEDIIVKDSLPTRISYEGNLEVDGKSVSGNIENGISIGDIDEGDYKIVTFDARISPKTSFVLGTTTLTNTVRVTSDNDSATDSAVVYVTIGTPTVVPTGITGNGFFDYVLIPFLLTLLAFVLFRKHFVALVKKLEGAGKEMRESW